MIVKRIYGLAGTGKTTELIKELHNEKEQVILFAGEVDIDIEDINRMKDRLELNFNTNENLILINKHALSYDICEKVKNNQIKIVLIDDNYYRDSNIPTLVKYLEELDVKKLVITTQLNKNEKGI